MLKRIMAIFELWQEMRWNRKYNTPEFKMMCVAAGSIERVL